MKKLLRTSLRFKYISSTLSITLVAFSMAGLLLYYNAVTHLHEANEQLVEDKLRHFAQDMEEQYKVLADISYIISTRAFYKKSFFERNSYNEIELLREFTKFKNNSPVITDYFLMYRDSDWVFKSTESKNTFDVFKSYYNINDSDGTLYDTLNNLARPAVIPCGRTDNTFIFALPVYTAGRLDTSGYATIGFFISPQSLKSRLDTLSGSLDGDVYACFENIHFTGVNTQAVPDARMAELVIDMTNGTIKMDNASTLYVCSSDSGAFKAVLRTPPDYKFENMRSFSYLSAAYILTAIVFLLIPALWVGNYNYRPIGRLLRKYVKSNGAAKGKNELESVEKLFDSLLLEKESVQLSLQRQYMMIKRQVLTLVLSGNTQYSELVSRSFMGICLSGSFFYLVVVNTTCRLDEEAENELTLMVEKLSDSDTSLYFVYSIRENYSAAVISAQDEQQASDAADCVITLFVERLGGGVSVAKRSEGLSGLHSTLMHAIKSIEASGDEKQMESAHESLVLPDGDLTDRIIEAVHLGNWRDVDFLFQLLNKKTKENTKPFLIDRIIYNNLLYKLVTFDKTNSLPMTTELIEHVTSAATYEELTTRLHELLRYVCENTNIIKEELQPEINSEGTDRHANELLDYINANYWNAGLSLDSLSEEFGISTRHISRIIKGETGVPYKEYLTNLRIKKASEFLLLDNLTITQACKKVGYEDLSNFIKTFKRITGFTPYSYSKKAKEFAFMQNSDKDI